jgi:lipoyl(octanoyl) transferase
MQLCSFYLLESGPGPAPFNMALDEALLEAMPRLAKPVLRFYGWTEPAASFGYFQKYADVERLTSLRPLVRRPTGGGLVFHDTDWTYSFVVPPSDPWYALTATESYRRVHQWIQAAFGRLDFPTELAAACHKSQPGQCFQGHEMFDLLWRRRKIAGAAQRRTRHGLLIQGSTQPGSLPLARTDWQRAMCDTARTEYGITWTSLELDIALKSRAQDLAGQKYSQPAHNRKR